jgi:hypothetical protein
VCVVWIVGVLTVFDVKLITEIPFFNQLLDILFQKPVVS